MVWRPPLHSWGIQVPDSAFWKPQLVGARGRACRDRRVLRWLGGRVWLCGESCSGSTLDVLLTYVLSYKAMRMAIDTVVTVEDCVHD